MRPFMRLTVLQNVQVGAYVKARGEEHARELARQAVARVGLSDCAGQVASTLTTRELRLMELARALAGQPELLLLDETLAGLGHGEVDDVLSVIRSLSADGMTIVIIEHTMQAMVRLVDQFVVLDHGEVLAVGDPASITQDMRVVEAYLGKKWSARHGSAGAVGPDNGRTGAGDANDGNANDASACDGSANGSKANGSNASDGSAGHGSA
jgi:branched-chain amino acid transport system permease protein